LTFKYVLKLMP